MYRDYDLLKKQGKNESPLPKLKKKLSQQKFLLLTPQKKVRLKTLYPSPRSNLPLLFQLKFFLPASNFRDPRLNSKAR